MPPVAGLATAKLQSPFGYINQVLSLAPGTIEKAAPHLLTIALAWAQDSPLLVLSFDDANWPAALLQSAEKAPDGVARLANGKACVVGTGRFLIVGAPDACANMGAAAFAPLASDPAFAQARGAAARGIRPPAGAAEPQAQAIADEVDAPLAWAYVAMPGLLKALGEHMPADLSKRFDAFCTVSGLNHARYAVVTCRRPEAPSGSEAVLTFQGDDARILRLIPQTRLEIAQDVPAGTASALLLSWGDAGAFLGGIRDLAVQSAEAASDHTLRDRLTEAEKRLGFGFDQLFSQVGSGAAVYYPEAPPASLMSLGDWTAVVLLKDPQAFEASAPNLSLALLGRTSHGTTFDGVPMVKLSQASIFYAIRDNRIVVGGSPKAVKKYLDWYADNGRKPLRAVIGDRPVPALAWADLRLLMEGYPMSEAGTKVALSLYREASELRVRATCEDYDAVRVSQAPTRLYFGALVAFFTALGRETQLPPPTVDPPTTRNTEEIGLAVALYRNGHGGEFPPDFQSLVDGGHARWLESFVEPSDTQPIVVSPKGLKSSYEYVGPIPKTTSGTAIIAYTRKGLYAEGRNVLHAGMSANWVTEGELADPAGNVRTSLRASYEVVVKAFGDKLTEERKAELQKFYEVED